MSHSYRSECKADFKTALDLTHDSRYIGQISGTGNDKALYDGIVKGVIENRVHHLLVRRGQARRTVFAVIPLIHAVPYEPDIIAEYFSHAEYTRTLAEWSPEGCLHVPVG